MSHRDHEWEHGIRIKSITIFWKACIFVIIYTLIIVGFGCGFALRETGRITWRTVEAGLLWGLTLGCFTSVPFIFWRYDRLLGGFCGKVIDDE